MNKELIRRKNISKYQLALIMIGVIQPIYYKKPDQYAAYMHFWNPISWIMILGFAILCIFNDCTVQELIDEVRKPKDKEWEKLSIWKAS